jgi:Protein of unknown function, DUF481
MVLPRVRLIPALFGVCLLTILVSGLVGEPCHAADAPSSAAAGKKTEPQPAPDTLIFANGDRLSGKLLRTVGDQVFFHSEFAGDIAVKWEKVKELRTGTTLVVLEKRVFPEHGTVPANLPQGTLTVADNTITVHPVTGAAATTIPVKQAAYVVDGATLTKQIAGRPGVLAGWKGTLTGGATVVQASQDEYTVTGSASVLRAVPTVAWLDTRNRTSADLSGSFGKIIQPAYTSGGVLTPASASMTSIYHADAERDEYFTPRLYALGQTSFDHNYGQALDLQQIYGAGIGWTAIRNPMQELDLKSTLQYESQTFLQAAPGQDQNLIGSTLNGTWAAKLPHKVVFKQQVSYIPAYNNPYAYSAGETDTLTMPFFKSFGFSLGSTDSYLNDPPAADPPTKRNSFELTTGLTYTLKTKY